MSIESDKAKLLNELKKKLQIIRLDLLQSGHSNCARDFFWVSIPYGTTARGLQAFRTVDLAQEFPNEILDFCKTHNVKACKTAKGFIFAQQ